ncbi:MAG: hypothetical protein ABW000_06230 [Actinoplanes sp.]
MSRLDNFVDGPPPAPDAPPVRPRAQVTPHTRDGVWLSATRVGAA